jgi:hypothetical protein
MRKPAAAPFSSPQVDMKPPGIEPKAAWSELKPMA